MPASVTQVVSHCHPSCSRFAHHAQAIVHAKETFFRKRIRFSHSVAVFQARCITVQPDAKQWGQELDNGVMDLSAGIVNTRTELSTRRWSHGSATGCTFWAQPFRAGTTATRRRTVAQIMNIGALTLGRRPCVTNSEAIVLLSLVVLFVVPCIHKSTCWFVFFFIHECQRLAARGLARHVRFEPLVYLLLSYHSGNHLMLSPMLDHLDWFIETEHDYDEKTFGFKFFDLVSRWLFENLAYELSTAVYKRIDKIAKRTPIKIIRPHRTCN